MTDGLESYDRYADDMQIRYVQAREGIAHVEEEIMNLEYEMMECIELCDLIETRITRIDALLAQ